MSEPDTTVADTPQHCDHADCVGWFEGSAYVLCIKCGHVMPESEHPDAEYLDAPWIQRRDSETTQFDEDKFYWVRVPLRRSWGGNWHDEGMSGWQPASYEEGRWILLGDNDICEGRPDFSRVVVHPVPMEAPDAN